MTDIPLLERLRLGHTTSGMKMLGEAADTIETQAAEIDFWKDRMREALKTIRENNDHIAKLEDDGFKYRMALADIQMKAQDILRPIPFQDEEN